MLLFLVYHVIHGSHLKVFKEFFSFLLSLYSFQLKKIYIMMKFNIMVQRIRGSLSFLIEIKVLFKGTSFNAGKSFNKIYCVNLKM